MATQPSLASKVCSSLCFQSVLGFFFNKGVRGGPRVLLNLAGLLVGLFIFVKLLPSHMTEGALQVIPLPKSVWFSVGNEEGSGPVGLRIVAFGELDIGTPVGANQEREDSKSWTRALCDRLACDTHISMVSPPDTASWSISSNDIYASGVEALLNETAQQEGPGHDYSFVSSFYPPQWKSWDLKAQIDRFLAQPKGPTPASTLWVVSFGQWDIWTLSALPSPIGKQSVDAMTRDIFEQMERLYEASMDPDSIAFSDINIINVEEPSTVGSQEQDLAKNETELQDEAQAGAQATTQESSATKGTAPEAVPTDNAQLRRDDTFHILIPKVMDPSLLPGWRDLRPQAPAVHSKAEQLRHSVTLADKWNDLIQDRMIDWVQKYDEADNDIRDAENGTTSTDQGELPLAPSVPAADERPKPIRDGFAYNLADFVLDHVMDRQLRNAHLVDGNGLGEGAIDAGFRDVRNPCLQPVAMARVAGPSTATAGDVKLSIPNKKLDQDIQVPRVSAADVGAARVKRAEFVDMPGLAYMSTARECDIPGDHLFYTPFALSQKAIAGIAGEVAQLILEGESVRTKLNKAA